MCTAQSDGSHFVRIQLNYTEESHTCSKLMLNEVMKAVLTSFCCDEKMHHGSSIYVQGGVELVWTLKMPLHILDEDRILSYGSVCVYSGYWPHHSQKSDCIYAFVPHPVSSLPHGLTPNSDCTKIFGPISLLCETSFCKSPFRLCVNNVGTTQECFSNIAFS